MLALPRKINKVFIYHEWEYRYQKGFITLQREVHRKSNSITQGISFQSKSLKSYQKKPRWISEVLKKLQKILHADANSNSDSYRIIFSHQSHQLKKIIRSQPNQNHQWKYWTFYIELIDKEQSFSQAFNFDNNPTSINTLFHSIENWLKKLKQYQNLPLKEKQKTGPLNPNTLLLSPNSVGLILHEILGHRLESDDFSQALQWSKGPSLSFQVLDTPGYKGKSGYTPFGDDGTKGEPIMLFDGLKRKSELIKAHKGSLRSVSADFHPIIRQRTLVTKILAKTPSCLSPPLLSNKSSLQILNIAEGNLISPSSRSSDQPQGHFIVSESIYTDKKGKSFRLEPFEFTFNDKDLLKLNFFGNAEFYVPGGGCHKGLQRGLSIAFKCHSAWMKI